jgi:putative DNA primase/helicase
MKDIPHWVMWKLEKRDGNLTKVPYQVNGKKVDTIKSETWTTYERAFTAYDSSIYAGLGFVLTKETGLIAIDLDHVLHNSVPPVNGCTFKE